MYNWQQSDWPIFRYALQGVEDDLLSFTEKAGRVSGILEALPEGMKVETVVDFMLTEAIQTSAIEGEYPDRNDVLSSIRKNLGIHADPGHIRDRSAEGLGRLMIEARKTYAEALTEDALFAWHDMLLGASKRVAAGRWRTHEDPMQVVSGPLGREKIHFEAPPSRDVPAHMNAFIEWFNVTSPGGKDEMKKAPVRAALAHLYFETIHPFEDGNGRIGRVIAEKSLSQTMGLPVILSLSRTIESNKKAYYDSLERAQRSNEVTPWVEYFVRTTLDAQREAERQLDFTLRKARFFDRHKDRLNARQLRVIQRMLEEGPDGFKGGMNARKYMAIARTSKATATRDMQDLLDIGAFIFAGTGGGRSTSYNLGV